jgi:hypothetical protein
MTQQPGQCNLLETMAGPSRCDLLSSQPLVICKKVHKISVNEIRDQEISGLVMKCAVFYV